MTAQTPAAEFIVNYTDRTGRAQEAPVVNAMVLEAVMKALVADGVTDIHVTSVK